MLRGVHFIGLMLLCTAAGLLLFVVHPWAAGPRYHRIRLERQTLVRELGLTDLCLFTEARYTRHPSQADLHSAFQDHPLALEHFPSGAMMPPPPALRTANPGPRIP